MKTITLISIICTLVISCVNAPPSSLTPAPIPSHLLKHVAISDGINFKTAQSVPLNPLTGNEITSCGEISIKSQDEYSKPKSSKCKTQVIDASPELLSIINTPSIIKGTILKNGKRISARFVIQVSALYEGSHCQTKYSLGSQYENCITLEQTCLLYKDHPGRDFLDAQCSQFPFWS